MEATSTTVKGENGVIAEILACLAQGSIAWFQEQQASGSTAPVAHIGNSFTYLSQSPSLGFLILVPPITSRVTNPYSLNFLVSTFNYLPKAILSWQIILQ